MSTNETRVWVVQVLLKALMLALIRYININTLAAVFSVSDHGCTNYLQTSPSKGVCGGGKPAVGSFSVAAH